LDDVAIGCLSGLGFLAEGFKGQLALVTPGEPHIEHFPPPFNII
jgi:hypothetical protein